MNRYDVIVVGSGGVGSSAAFHLARRGLRVLAFDQYQGGHDRGSSHGETRVIRKAYFEHPDYVPLLHRAYELWHELESLQREQLYRGVGLVQIGPPDGPVIQGVLESARLHNLTVERWNESECRRFIPGFRIPDGYQAVFEREAGYLHVERCVLAHLDQAVRAGAEMRYNEPVVEWTANGQGFRIRTVEQSYDCDKLVISAGAWAEKCLPDTGVRLRVLRKHLHWYRCRDVGFRQESGCPTFLYDLPEGCFYGFPVIGNQEIKVAEHSGGSEVSDPTTDDRLPEPADGQRVTAFVTHYLQGVTTEEIRHKVCFYTMSPDHHFIVDQHPEYSGVVFAAGLSGHGFKFVTVLGEILADLVASGTTQLPAGFLRLSRFARGTG